MRRWWVVLAAVPVVVGCDGGGDEISVRRPQLLSALGSSDGSATARVCRKSNCSKPVKEQQFELVGDRYTTTLRLWAGSYYLKVEFATDAVPAAAPLPLAAYPEHKIEIGAHVDSRLTLDERTLETAFDFDGDGIANLDELRFGFEPGQPEGDEGGDRALVRISSGAVTARIGSDTASVAEAPEHNALLARGYQIDRFEVSQRRYRRCVAAGACPPPIGVDHDSYLASTLDQPDQDPVLVDSVRPRPRCSFSSPHVAGHVHSNGNGGRQRRIDSVAGWLRDLIREIPVRARPGGRRRALRLPRDSPLAAPGRRNS